MARPRCRLDVKCDDTLRDGHPAVIGDEAVKLLHRFRGGHPHCLQTQFGAFLQLLIETHGQLGVLARFYVQKNRSCSFLLYSHLALHNVQPFVPHFCARDHIFSPLRFSGILRSAATYPPFLWITLYVVAPSAGNGTRYGVRAGSRATVPCLPLPVDFVFPVFTFSNGTGQKVFSGGCGRKSHRVKR